MNQHVSKGGVKNPDNQNVKRQNHEEHRKRRDVFLAFAVEDVNNHLAGTGEQTLDSEPDAAILTQYCHDEIVNKEFRRIWSRVGTLATFRTEFALEFGAAIKALGSFGYVVRIVFQNPYFLLNASKTFAE